MLSLKKNEKEKESICHVIRVIHTITEETTIDCQYVFVTLFKSLNFVAILPVFSVVT